MSKQNKATKAEIEERLRMIEKMMLLGHRLPAIKKFIKTQTNWDLKDAQIYNYVRNVRQNWGVQYNNREIEEIRAEQLALRWDCFRLVREKNYMRLCLEYLKDIAELEGLYNIEQRVKQSKESELLEKIADKIDEMEPGEILSLFRKIDRDEI